MSSVRLMFISAAIADRADSVAASNDTCASRAALSLPAGRRAAHFGPRSGRTHQSSERSFHQLAQLRVCRPVALKWIACNRAGRPGTNPAGMPGREETPRGRASPNSIILVLPKSAVGPLLFFIARIRIRTRCSFPNPQSFTADRIFIRTDCEGNSLRAGGLFPGLRKPQHAALRRHRSHCRACGGGDFVYAATGALKFDRPHHDIGCQRGFFANRASRRIVPHGTYGRWRKSYHAARPEASAPEDGSGFRGRGALVLEAMSTRRRVRPCRVS